MNSIMRDQYDEFRLYQALREQLLGVLDDADLAYAPGGANLSLGALCREMGEIEYSYVQSFRVFTQDVAYRCAPAEATRLEGSVAALTAWYATLDGELRAAVEALSEDDLASRAIDRGDGFLVRPQTQLRIYQEALLIFYGKAGVYLKALGKPLSEQWQSWIG